MPRDWKGGTASVFKTIGASNHAAHERAERDYYYATEPAATEWLLRIEHLQGPVLEPACGEGHISRVLQGAGLRVVSRDIEDRGFGEVADFLAPDWKPWEGDIVTNPPYAFAREFVERALAMVPERRKVCMFLKLTFLEGKRRRALFDDYPPRRIWVSRARLKCAMNGDFEHTGGSATAYGWFVWVKGWKRKPEIGWFN